VLAAGIGAGPLAMHWIISLLMQAFADETFAFFFHPETTLPVPVCHQVPDATGALSSIVPLESALCRFPPVSKQAI
jgi:hypothetical protein